MKYAQRETNCIVDVDLIFSPHVLVVFMLYVSSFVFTLDSSVILLFCLRHCNFDDDLIVFHCFSPHCLVVMLLFCSINCNFDVDLTVFHLIVWE